MDAVLASEVLYDPREAAPLATQAARLLPNGGTLLLADPAAGRAQSARAAATDALRELGATVSEVPPRRRLRATAGTACAGDGSALGWRAHRAAASRVGGAARVSMKFILTLRAIFGTFAHTSVSRKSCTSC